MKMVLFAIFLSLLALSHVNLYGQQTDSVHPNNIRLIIQISDSVQSDAYYKRMMMDSLRVYTGINTQGTIQLIDTFKKIIEEKPIGTKLKRRELDIIFGHTVLIYAIKGLFDYCMEKSDDVYYRNLVVFFAESYILNEYKGNVREIDKKILAGHKKGLY